MTDRTPASPVEVRPTTDDEVATLNEERARLHRWYLALPEDSVERDEVWRAIRLVDGSLERAALQAQDHTITKGEHALHFDPDCEECVYLARPVAIHVPEGPGARSAALHEAWVRNGGDYYFGPLFWDEVVARFSEVASLIESATKAQEP